MHVWMKIHQIAEALDELDERRPRTGLRRPAGLRQQLRRHAAKLSQPGAPARKERAQRPRHGEHVLAVRDRREDAHLHPLTVEQHSLLVTARTEVPRPARESQKVIVPAGLAANAGEAEVRIAAFN